MKDQPLPNLPDLPEGWKWRIVRPGTLNGGPEKFLYLRAYLEGHEGVFYAESLGLMPNMADFTDAAREVARQATIHAYQDGLIQHVNGEVYER